MGCHILSCLNMMSIHFALIVKGTSQCMNRVRSTDGSPSEQKFPVSQKIVLIILSAEGIVLTFFSLKIWFDAIPDLPCFGVATVTPHLASQSQCSGHHHSQQHVSISCEATVVYAFLWSSAVSPVSTIIPVIPKAIQYPFTLDNFCKDHFQTNHHFCKIYHHFVFLWRYTQFVLTIFIHWYYGEHFNAWLNLGRDSMKEILYYYCLVLSWQGRTVYIVFVKQ